MEKLNMRFDTQNPFIFMIVMTLAVVFALLSLSGTIALLFLLYLFVNIDGTNLYWSMFLRFLVVLMIFLGSWNIYSSVKLIANCDISRFVGLILRSLIIIVPFAIFGFIL